MTTDGHADGVTAPRKEGHQDVRAASSEANGIGANSPCLPPPEQDDIDQSHLDRIRDLSFQPIFIQGEHRSGTTILYKLLGLTGRFNIITAYHIFYANQLLHRHINGTTQQGRDELEAMFNSWPDSTRVIDSMPLNADLPEEYGMHLFRKSANPKLTKKNLDVMQTFCRKVQFISDPTRPLLLKSPWDFSRFLFLKQALPNARFVFIHRHPIHILNSQLKAIQTNQKQGNPYVKKIVDVPGFLQTIHKSRPFQKAVGWASSPGNPFHLGLKYLASSGEKARREYIQHINELPKDCYVSVTYEQLCSDPEATMNIILNFVGADRPEGVDYREFISPRPLNLAREIQEREDKLRKKFAVSMNYHGYE